MMMRIGRTVENHSQQGRVVQRFQAFFDHLALADTLTRYQQHSIRQAPPHIRIGNRHEGGRVNDDPVKQGTHTCDVVIGYLEPHDRPETAALAEGLEVVPRLRTQHGQLELEEMDADAVIRRSPEVALIDELAHTNASGMRNEKRYQDIDEVLAAGIDVVSTVNIQHLESLNDAIAELTEVRVRETFPDSVLEEADEVVLVDLSPEALQDRLRAERCIPRIARRRRSSTSSAPTSSRPCASSRCARWLRTSGPGAMRPCSIPSADRRSRSACSS